MGSPISLQERVARLEIQNRWMKGALAALLVGGILWSLGTAPRTVAAQRQTSAPSERVLTANRLQLVDQDGTVRMALVADRKGAVLAMMDAKGQSLVTLEGPEQKQPAIFLSDEKGKMRVKTFGGSKLSGLALYDPLETVRCTFVVHDDGTFGVYDSQGNQMLNERR